jgi:hypothetical protein
MPKFILIAEHDDETRTTVEFNQDFLPEVLMHMDMFLRGTGFSYDGSLTIESWNEYPSDTGQEPVTETELNTKCSVCGLTDEQLGHHACFDQRCPKRPATYATYTIAGKYNAD